MPEKGPKPLPAEAANVTSKASTDQESLRSFGVRSSFWGEPMPCQTPSGERDAQGEGMRPVPRAPEFTTSHATSASQGGDKAGDTQQEQQLAPQCSCTDNSPGSCQTTPLGSHGEGLDGGGMTREHHAWLAMARSNCHRRHLFAVVCPMPQSDTPWVVVSPSWSTSVPQHWQHLKPQDHHNPPPFDIFRFQLVNHFLLKKRKPVGFNRATQAGTTATNPWAHGQRQCLQWDSIINPTGSVK